MSYFWLDDSRGSQWSSFSNGIFSYSSTQMVLFYRGATHHSLCRKTLTKNGHYMFFTVSLPEQPRTQEAVVVAVTCL